jgi:hypothetical protein
VRNSAFIYLGHNTTKQKHDGPNALLQEIQQRNVNLDLSRLADELHGNRNAADAASTNDDPLDALQRPGPYLAAPPAAQARV